MRESDSPQRRLDRALARIEAATARLGKSTGDADALSAVTAERDRLMQEVAQLREENKKLTAALQDASEKQRATQSSAGQIAKRLDGAVDQLKLVLEN